MNKLWTKDFTIITLGSVISMLGNAVAGFAIGLLVFEMTQSTLLYAVFMICYSLPRVIMPLFAGPWLDRFSRRKMIYMLDFFSSGFYLLIATLLYLGWFNYIIFLLLCMVVGSVDSMYTVAYESFYPTLISKGNYSKAYSISSLLYPLANTVMVPIAGICYETVGMTPLFLFNAVTFFAAAVFETRISSNEKHLANREAKAKSFSFKEYGRDMRIGVDYLKKEKGLLTITAYFFINALTGAALSTLTLPFFERTPGLGVPVYTVVMAVATFGRLVGGLIHYRFRYPVDKKFAIALAVYIIISLLDGSYMFMPLAVMIVFQFLVGITGVTSYNIRISSTQNYVPDEMRGRFNGLFQMCFMAGMILGQLAAGALGDIFPERNVVAVFMGLNVVGALLIMFRNRRYVKPIYNTEA